MSEADQSIRSQLDALEKRWGKGRRWAYQLIEGAGVVENVRHGAQTDRLPIERQARELAKLPDPEQGPAWDEAVDTAPEGKVTARHVADVVATRLNPEPSRDASEPDPPASAEPLPRVVKLTIVDRAMGNVRNMNEAEVYEFKNRFQEYLRERALGGASE